MTTLSMYLEYHKAVSMYFNVFYVLVFLKPGVQFLTYSLELYRNLSSMIFFYKIYLVKLQYILSWKVVSHLSSLAFLNGSLQNPQ